MHELAVTRAIISQICEECEAKGIRPAEASIQLGLLTSYRKEPILYYFDILKKEAGIDSCSLKVDEVPGSLRCNSCGEESEIEESLSMFCPKCDSSDIDIVKGRDIKILSIRRQQDVR
jgi:hydrogenase nickel incorporation protein HypA/HybF